MCPSFGCVSIMVDGYRNVWHHQSVDTSTSHRIEIAYKSTSAICVVRFCHLVLRWILVELHEGGEDAYENLQPCVWGVVQKRRVQMCWRMIAFWKTFWCTFVEMVSRAFDNFKCVKRSNILSIKHTFFFKGWICSSSYWIVLFGYTSRCILLKCCSM